MFHAKIVQIQMDEILCAAVIISLLKSQGRNQNLRVLFQGLWHAVQPEDGSYMHNSVFPVELRHCLFRKITADKEIKAGIHQAGLRQHRKTKTVCDITGAKSSIVGFMLKSATASLLNMTVPCGMI